jgi:hypothetical protein
MPMPALSLKTRQGATTRALRIFQPRRPQGRPALALNAQRGAENVLASEGGSVNRCARSESFLQK